MSEELRDKLVEYMEATTELRFAFSSVDYGADAVELHTALVNVQDCLTSLESYLSKAIRAKALLDRRVVKYKMVFQEAWDRAIVATNKRPALSEYATGKEKAAEANLATLEQARQLRREEELLSFAVEAADIIRLHYYGIDKVRQDIRKRLDMSQTDYYS